MSKPWIITGGAGFIGANLVQRVLERYPNLQLIVVDALTYAGHKQSLPRNDRLHFVHTKVQNSETISALLQHEEPECVIHLAAETHVDRSIYDPQRFMDTNVIGTFTLLEALRKLPSTRLVLVSTDEVYGSLGSTGSSKETDPINPSSPYSASKASADLLALSYFNTYGTDVVITRCSNNYGPFQMPEKFIPLIIENALKYQPIPIYGDGKQIREWIHVNDHVEGILRALKYGSSGEVYNLGSQTELTNLELASKILQVLNRPVSLLQHVQDRPGHDRRYALDSQKAEQELGFRAQHQYDKTLPGVVKWYQENRTWCDVVQSREHLRHIQKTYDTRRMTLQ